MIRWVKVTDSLPDHSNDVIIIDVADDVHIASYDSDWDEFVLVYGQAFDTKRVKMWRPLDDIMPNNEA